MERTMITNGENGENGESGIAAIATRAIHAGQEPSRWRSRAVVPPITLSTTYQQTGPNETAVSHSLRMETTVFLCVLLSLISGSLNETVDLFVKLKVRNLKVYCL